MTYALKAVTLVAAVALGAAASQVFWPAGERPRNQATPSNAVLVADERVGASAPHQEPLPEEPLPEEPLPEELLPEELLPEESPPREVRPNDASDEPSRPSRPRTRALDLPLQHAILRDDKDEDSTE